MQNQNPSRGVTFGKKSRRTSFSDLPGVGGMCAVEQCDCFDYIKATCFIPVAAGDMPTVQAMMPAERAASKPCVVQSLLSGGVWQILLIAASTPRHSGPNTISKSSLVTIALKVCSVPPVPKPRNCASSKKSADSSYRRPSRRPQGPRGKPWKQHPLPANSPTLYMYMCMFLGEKASWFHAERLAGRGIAPFSQRIKRFQRLHRLPPFLSCTAGQAFPPLLSLTAGQDTPLAASRDEARPSAPCLSRPPPPLRTPGYRRGADRLHTTRRGLSSLPTWLRNVPLRLEGRSKRDSQSNGPAHPRQNKPR